MNILVVEDDDSISSYIVQGLKKNGHESRAVQNGPDSLKVARDAKFDVIIMDRMLPGMDGLSVIRELRKGGVDTPTLILSALGEVDDRVTGLRSGGDDYLVKPFAMDELLARVEILARRNNGNGQAETTLSAGNLTLDLIHRQVKRGDKTIDLQSREFKLLEYMLRHKGQIVTRTMLLENVWDYHFDPQTNIIDVHISRLRGKIDKDFEKSLLKTVRGSGYMIDDDV
jgi:two-component system OmpR family response regulator